MVSLVAGSKAVGQSLQGGCAVVSLTWKGEALAEVQQRVDHHCSVPAVVGEALLLGLLGELAVEWALWAGQDVLEVDWVVQDVLPQRLRRPSNDAFRVPPELCSTPLVAVPARPVDQGKHPK